MTGVQTCALPIFDKRAAKEDLKNVKTVLSQPDDPGLPPNTIDAVLMLKTYHEVAHPVTLLKNLQRSLRPGAKVGIIDRKGTGENHGVDQDVVLREADEAGYRLVSQSDFVKADDMDYFLILVVK